LWWLWIWRWRISRYWWERWPGEEHIASINAVGAVPTLVFVNQLLLACPYIGA